PVVSRVSDHCQPYLRRTPARKRISIDLRLNRLAAELRQRNGADDPQFIARRTQIERNSASHDDRMQDRFVAVAIDQYQIIASNHRVPDDLVRRRGAVDDEKSMVGTEIASSPRLCR